MPEYSYACDGCTAEIDLYRKVSDRDKFPTCLGSHSPQPMRRAFYTPEAIMVTASDILMDWTDENYRRVRANVPRFSPDHVNRPGTPLPGKAWAPKRRKRNA